MVPAGDVIAAQPILRSSIGGDYDLYWLGVTQCWERSLHGNMAAAAAMLFN